MKRWMLVPLLATVAFSCAGPDDGETTMNAYNQLTDEEARVILHRGTERPFSGEFNELDKHGLYRCRQCEAPLYLSGHKFKSECGWPSFDNEISGAIKRKPDPDGSRVEIVCAGCDGHLGHVFKGENLTPRNVRHCVNSISMTFEAVEGESMGRAFFAGGCFWGVEHLLQSLPGVLTVVSGYMGGESEHPTYKEVCSGRSGHLETVEVLYDPARVSYEAVAMRFFEIHDPTQADGQGPDIGPQYRSAIFVADKEERATIEKLIGQLKERDYKVATQVLPQAPFWPAEAYHQDYYEHKGTEPYCHAPVKRFGK